MSDRFHPKRPVGRLLMPLISIHSSRLANPYFEAIWPVNDAFPSLFLRRQRYKALTVLGFTIPAA